MNQRKTRITAFLLALVMLMSLLAACSKQEESNEPQQPANQNEQKEPEKKEEEKKDPEPPKEEKPAEVTVTDMQGNTVTVTEPPQRIGSCAIIPSYIMLCLGLQDRLAFIEDKKFACYNEFVDSAVLDAIGTAGGMKNFSVETAMSMSPDMVILPLKQASTMEQFQSAGVNTYIGSPETLDEMRQFVTDLGKVFYVEDRATALLEYNDKVWADVEKRLSGLTDADKPTVYMNGSGDRFNSLTAQMFQNDLINAAGGTLISTDLDDTYWVKISAEQLQVYNPDVILMPASCSVTFDEWYGDSTVSMISAVSNKDIYQFPSTVDFWDYPTPTACLGLVWLANQLHPDLVPADVAQSYILDYYKTFFDRDYTLEELGITLK